LGCLPHHAFRASVLPCRAVVVQLSCSCRVVLTQLPCSCLSQPSLPFSLVSSSPPPERRCPVRHGLTASASLIATLLAADAGALAALQAARPAPAGALRVQKVEIMDRQGFEKPL